MQYRSTCNRIGTMAGTLAIVVAAAACSLFMARPVQAAQQVTAVSTPTIAIDLEPYAPDGAMRLYSVANGSSYWTQDMPIYQGDTVKVDVFVATGANELQELKVRLDNNLMATLTSSPWSTVLSTDQLAPGYHFIEAWAQVSGAKPKTPQFATESFTFFVSPGMTDGTVPQSQVKGQAQVLSNGQVTNVPLENDSTGAPLTPDLPAVLATAGNDVNAGVVLSIKDQATNKLIPMTSGQPTEITAPAVVAVHRPHGSSAVRFVYSITSEGQTVQASGKTYPVDTTDILLQPRTQSLPGMLNGVSTLWVWGVDARGDYGQPASTSIDIENASGD